ncbi:MAG: GGDEF domain-containing protein [Vicinamibacteria bacterium]|nr:GGDEF domain-containing protein [Vicinamibacteria bacterium]
MTVPAPPTPLVRLISNPLTVWSGSVVMIVGIGWIDFFSGTELRLFPLYYAPISLLAWNVGRTGALAAAFISATAWFGCNYLAGMEFSSPGLWMANTLVLGTSFAIVGLLISTLKVALTREQELSRTDPLTSLLNRRAFYEEGGRILALCRRKNRPVTLAYMDLDNFKTVNDTLGHDAGDGLLRIVSEALRASTRPSDICARLGGDEFAVLLAEADPGDATVVLERLRRMVSDRFASMAVPVTCSLGAIAFMVAPEHMDKMVSAADSRMYAAKAAGKNRLHLEVEGAGGD